MKQLTVNLLLNEESDCDEDEEDEDDDEGEEWKRK
jgi:hypothetical protein